MFENFLTLGTIIICSISTFTMGVLATGIYFIGSDINDYIKEGDFTDD